MKINLDPRYSVIEKRLAGIKNIIAVTGWKGGVGKSSVSCLLALLLAKEGFKTGLMDFDFTGASLHTLLGVKDEFPKEIDGLLPPDICGVKFMSASFFTKEKAALFRGVEITDAVVELLAVTNWGAMDFLIIDMPPGVSDTALDCARFIKKAKFLVVQTPSLLSKTVALNAGNVFKVMDIETLGVVENMSLGNDKEKYLAQVAYDKDFESAIGNCGKLLESGPAKNLQPAVAKLKNLFMD